MSVRPAAMICSRRTTSSFSLICEDFVQAVVLPRNLCKPWSSLPTRVGGSIGFQLAAFAATGSAATRQVRAVHGRIQDGIESQNAVGYFFDFFPDGSESRSRTLSCPAESVGQRCML